MIQTNASFQEDEFINPFCTRVQEIGESSSRNIDNTDVHSFQPQSHDYRWTRDHPLEQVRGNPTMLVQTRRQLATDPVCIVALTVSIVERRTLRRQRLFCLDRSLQEETSSVRQTGKSGKLVDNHFSKMIIKLKEEGSTQVFSNLSDDVKTSFLNGPLRRRFMLLNQKGSFPDHSEKSLLLRKALYGLKQGSKGPAYDELSNFPSPDVPKALLSTDQSKAPQRKHFQTLIMPDALILNKSHFWRDTVLGDKLVKLVCQETKCTEMSSVEAEYVAFLKLCSRNVDEDTTSSLCFNYNKIPLYCDSTVSLSSLCNPVHLSWNKATSTRLGINLMIQPEPEDLPKDNPKLEIAVLRTQESTWEPPLVMENLAFGGYVSHESKEDSNSVDGKMDSKEENSNLLQHVAVSDGLSSDVSLVKIHNEHLVEPELTSDRVDSVLT
ncbi:hypothetical protein Tco_1292819 [Tanacetum coccineum]